MLLDLLSIVYMLAFAGCGILLAREIFINDGALRRVVYGLTLGLVMLIWLPALFAFLFGFGLAAQILALLTALIAAVGTRLALSKSRRGFIEGASAKKSAFSEISPFLIAAAPLVLIGWALHFNHTIVPASNGSLHVGQCTYGDLCMHLGFISSISVQKAFPPEYSLLPGTMLGYPFLCDSVSSTFLTLGASLRTAALLPALYAHLTLVLGVLLFFNTWFKSKKTAFVAAYLFFIGGGLGFYYIFNNQKLLAEQGVDRLKDMMQGFYLTPTNMPAEGLRWVNTIADMVLPQRATLFGWALLFPALELLYRAAVEKKKKLFIPIGVLAGAMPLVHTHSFVALGIISAFLYVLSVFDALTESKQNQTSKTAATVSAFLFALALLGALSLLPLAEEKDGIALKIKTAACVLIGAAAAAAALARMIRLIAEKRFGAELILPSAFAAIALAATFVSRAALKTGSVFALVCPIVCIAIILLMNALLNKGEAGRALPKDGEDGIGWLGYFTLFGIIALALAAPQLFLFTFKQSADSSSFLRWNFNWDNRSDGFLWFYVKNLGLIFILMPVAFLMLKRENRRFYSGSLVIWAVCEMLLFQPNPYDNNKLLFIWFAFTCGIVADLLAKALLKKAYISADNGGERRLDVKRTAARLTTLAIALVIMTLSGVMTLAREYVSGDHYGFIRSADGKTRFGKIETGYELVSENLARMADWVKENTPDDAVFLTHNNHNNAIAMLTGRSLFCGSGTFLHWHGINYRERAKLIDRMYAEPEKYLHKYAKEYGFDYVLISSYETGSYNVDKTWFGENLTEVYRDGSLLIYKIP